MKLQRTMRVVAIVETTHWPSVILKDRVDTTQRFEIDVHGDEVTEWARLIGREVWVTVEPTLQAAHARDEDPPVSEGSQVAELITRGEDG